MSTRRWVWNKGRGRRAKTTPWWLFGIHLVLVFSATVGTMLAFSKGEREWGMVCAAAWLVLFAITAMDNVRIQWIDWLGVRVGVWLDTLRSVGDSEINRDENGRFRSVREEPPLPDVDVDQR